MEISFPSRQRIELLRGIHLKVQGNLSLSADEADPIHQCGQSALSIIKTRPTDVIHLARTKLHAYPYKDVPVCWRRLYTDAAIYHAMQVIQSEEEREIKKCKSKVEVNKGADSGTGSEDRKRNEDWIQQVVQILDMAVILTGAPKREELIDDIMKGLLNFLNPEIQEDDNIMIAAPPHKRRKITSSIPWSFPIPSLTPGGLRCPIQRTEAPEFEDFQAHISRKPPEHDPYAPTPLIITGAIANWPALSEASRSWNDPSYLLRQTLGGRRLVPIELGRSYTDDDWGQSIVTFKEFMERYMLRIPTSPEDGPSSLAYLAQHDLFAQIPSLRSDIMIPDYCYTSPPSSDSSSTPKLEEPLLNAWFGPAGTVSPLHTDPYHNILAQVVGYKYVRLYPSSENSKMYPRGIGENGVDMGNTSHVDLDEFMELFEGRRTKDWAQSGHDTARDSGTDHSEKRGREVEKEQQISFEERFPEFKHAEYLEGILGPGDCLYLPVTWWHYVRSLSTSFSVSFWWN
ncbi:Clavaminate synthase-like protein [Patellaria atrata CBS 101060]|uniref:Clavaminate synthase-like protein n=1 Tax=Patellaria atrata CBS 101060 TaxID=1346257 RepID=A0A9P4SCJ3_9PEZI|nr:Clavaminate synthase-like protein [Patellaria atrata CBS 101060]